MEPTSLSMALILPLYLSLIGPGGTIGQSKAEARASVAPPDAKHAAMKPSATEAQAKPAGTKPAKAKRIDHSGQTRKGKASYYGPGLYGKKMADGKPMNPRSNVAASKTLPLGTRARVTNLENGKSEVVVIEDRGPYVPGRVIDVSPKTAEQLDLKRDGVAPVEVKPLHVPRAGAQAGAGEGRPSK